MGATSTRDDQWLMITIWAVFPPTWGENPPKTCIFLRSGPASHREAWEFSPELQRAQGCSPTRERRMGFSGPSNWQRWARCFPTVALTVLLLFCSCLLWVNYWGSRTQGLKAREQRLQRFGWFMGRSRKGTRRDLSTPWMSWGYAISLHCRCWNSPRVFCKHAADCKQRAQAQGKFSIALLRWSSHVFS